MTSSKLTSEAPHTISIISEEIEKNHQTVAIAVFQAGWTVKLPNLHVGWMLKLRKIPEGWKVEKLTKKQRHLLSGWMKRLLNQAGWM